MASNVAKPIAYRFGSFEFDPQTGELRKQGLRVRLEGQPVAILTVLLERPNQLVAREELQKRLWPDDTFVDFEQSLNAAVRRLRLALDDSAESPRYIETLARKGYRWVAPVTRTSDVVRIEENYPVPKSATARSSRVSQIARIVIVGGAVLAIVIGAWSVFRSRPPTGRVMLAVLPFQNLGNDPQQPFLADGMTEEMITQLGGLNPERLGVIARTSASLYKATNKNAGQIARELNVNYLLEGGVRRDGQRIRVTARLIQASDQADVWAGSYDSDVGDILKVQSEVARAIARQIQNQVPKVQWFPRSRRQVARHGEERFDTRSHQDRARNLLEIASPAWIIPVPKTA